MAVTTLNNYFCNAGGGTTAFTGNLRFNNTANAGTTTLDFAWNDPDTTFLNAEVRVSSGTDNSTAHRRFYFNGTSNQLQNAFTSWSTATSTLSFNGTFGRLGKVRHALMQIFEEPTKEIKKQMSKKDMVLLRAKRKSEKLLHQWLSKKEYDSLKLHGELAIQSKMDDEVIFIVKKDPNAMVDVKKKGTYSHKLCAVSEDLEMPVGDQLLSKLLLIKTDEKKFREVAIKH
ncbi:MAG TPA: hypothetical protein ENH95_06075 [Nitrosopumilus sp.]|nr:hypothetical protein [Nitrosopumilus sp.]